MDTLKKIISTLPKSPGVYQFINASGNVIYVGKAKNLHSRVKSYFSQKKFASYKIKALISQVRNIEHIIVESESDALLLENNFIKKLQPKYNVLLKDDKTFPWICIKNEAFPRVFSTRKIVKDGSEYFGPYTSGYMVKTLLSLIRELYPLRNCTFNLSDDNIKKKKFKKCLEYHLGNCKAPCEELQTAEEYLLNIKQIKNILQGNIHEVIEYLRKLMFGFSEEYKYENAELIKQKISLLERYKSKSTIVNPKLTNVDVFSYIERNTIAIVNFLKIVSGAIVQSHTVELKKRLNERKEELLLFAILDIRDKVNSVSKEILVPFNPGVYIDGVKYHVPKSGEKKKLLILSEKNAGHYLIQKEKIFEQREYATRSRSFLEQVKTDLKLKENPTRIECFDISNIQGTHSVASCIVFIDGKPAKKEYRHYNIKSVSKANDFASMKEIVYRRYKRQIEENSQLPQLIVIDGGKGQVSSAVESLKKLDLYDTLPIIGIAKRLEEIYFPNDSVPLYLNKNSQTLKLIQQLRNEAHRFGINFHRDKRSKSMLKNRLEEIHGVGKKSAEKLLGTFGSIEMIQQKPAEEIAEVVGKSIAEKILKALNDSK